MRDEDEEGPSQATPSVAPADDLEFPGHTVAGYVLDGEIGRGGMGVVYAATHPLIGKRVAIKVLSQELASDRVTLERFLLEARAVNAIGHPNIVDTFDFGILPDGRQYLVMDLLVGETLRTRLRRGALSIGEASIIIDEVASALAAAHAKGIIHRDLKPDNVFIVVQPGRPPQIKLLDFGLVKLTATSTDGVERTRSGAIVGTPNYMSPEQARARGHLDHRTDIYALGVVSFEMIAGHLPFIRDNALDTLIAHVQEEIPSLHETVDRVPIELAQMVELMMAKAPSDRPTLAAIRQVLKRMPRGEISMRVEYKSPKAIAPPQRTVSERPRPGTPRPVLEIPPDLEQASSPSIPEPRARSSPSFVDDYNPDPDEDHTVVSVPPPPGRAPTAPSSRRATTPPPMRAETPPMGTRTRRESVAPRLERPPTQPAPQPFEEADDLNSAWQPSNTDATTVTPAERIPPTPPPRAPTRETTPPPTRAVTRPGDPTPATTRLPSILARASSVAEPSESETAAEPPPDERPLPTRRTAPRVSTSNVSPTERVPSLAVPITPPRSSEAAPDTLDEEPLHTWPKEAPTLVTPPEVAALAREPAPTPRSSSDSDVITSAPRSHPTDPPPLATPSVSVDNNDDDDEIEVAWTIEPTDGPADLGPRRDVPIERAASVSGEIAPTTTFDVPPEADDLGASTSTEIDGSIPRATSEPGDLGASTSMTEIDASIVRATSEPGDIGTGTSTSMTEIDASIVRATSPTPVPTVPPRPITAAKPHAPPTKPVVPAPPKPPPRSVPAWALATTPSTPAAPAPASGSVTARAATDTTSARDSSESSSAAPGRPPTTPPTSPARPPTTPPTMSPTTPGSTRSGRTSEPNASIAAASLGKRTPKPTPFAPARTVRDSIANLASIQTGPPRSDAAIPERPTLQNLAVPERPTVRDLEMPERPTVKDVEVPLGDSMFDAETSIGSTEVELEASEPALTMEVDDPRPTGELSAVQDVEGLLEGIPSGIPSETAAQDDTAVPTRSPKTRSSPNLAELWSSELERSTAKRAAVEASDESAMTPAESVVAITSSEPIAESTPTAAAAAPGTTTITSRRATTNTRLADAPAKPEQHAPPTAQDDDDGSSLLGAFGFDIQVKIDLPFDDDLGPTDFLTTSSVPTPTVTAEPVVPEKSGKSKRPSKRSLTKPPLEDATDSAPLERRSSKSIPSADTPSRRSSDRLTRPPSVAASNETSPAADDNSVDKSGRTPSARAIEKAIDRQIAGRDPVGGSRVWLYVIIAIALGGIGVLVYLKLT